MARSFLGISPGSQCRGWKLLHGCHGNRHLPLPLTSPPAPNPSASQETPGGRHRFAAGATSVGGVTGLLASRLRYRGLQQVGRLGLNNHPDSRKFLSGLESHIGGLRVLSSHLPPAGLAAVLVSRVGRWSFSGSGRGLKQPPSENSREEACSQGQQEQGQQGDLVHRGP